MSPALTEVEDAEQAQSALLARTAEKDEPTWDDDLLDRKQYGIMLKHLLEQTEGPYVVAVNADWGMGKTFFLKALHNDFKATAHPCVYFNAWENDYCQDPLVSLVGGIKKELALEDSDSKDLIQAAETIAKNTIKAVPTAFKGIIKAFAQKFLGDDYSEVVADLTATASTSIVDEFLKEGKKRKSFIDSLEKIVAQKTSPTKNQIVIIIDELDRCRPDFSILFLERIKHLFNIKGLVFVLGVDCKQLLMVTENVFGIHSECSSDNNKSVIADRREIYLTKFIDFFYNLPTPDTQKYAALLLQKNANLPCSNKLGELNRHGINFFEILSCVTKDTGKSLREISQKIAIYAAITKCYNMTLIESFCVLYMTVCTSTMSSDSFINNTENKTAYDVMVVALSDKKLDKKELFYIAIKLYVIYDYFIFSSKNRISDDVFRKHCENFKNNYEVLWGMSYPIKAIIGQDVPQDLHDSVAQKISFVESFIGFPSQTEDAPSA